MIISHDYKFIFFAVGKTGTHTIESVLKKYDDKFIMNKEEQNFFLEHIPPYFLRKKLSSEIWGNYFKFAFVRNTWDMVISDLFWNKLVDINVEYISIEDVYNLYENQKQYRRGITWRTSREQHSFLSDKRGNLLVYFVGRFENIQEDFNSICDFIGIPREHLPVLNARNHRPHRQYYNPETIETVRRLWKRDIENFAFEFSAPENRTQTSKPPTRSGLDCRPKRRECVKETRVMDRVLLEAPEEDRRTWLNGTSRAIWDLCDGARTIDQIGSELSQRFAAVDRNITGDVHAIIAELHANRFLDIC